MTTATMINPKDQVRVDPMRRLITPVTDKWWLPLVTGIAWLIVSVVIFRFDYSTVTAVAVLFGIVALASGVNEVLLATISTKGWRVFYLLLATLSVAVGIVSFIHPGDTFVALAALVSFYLVFRGTFDLIQAFSVSRNLPGWWLLVISAIAELLLGFWAAGSWNTSVVVLVAWVGAATLIRGITGIVSAFQLRDVGHAVRP